MARENAERKRDRIEAKTDFVPPTSSDEKTLFTSIGGRSEESGEDAEREENRVYDAGLPIGDQFWEAMPNGAGGRQGTMRQPWS